MARGGDGNTSPSPSRAHTDTKCRVNQLKRWFFTWNNPPMEGVETVETVFRQYCDKYVFQEEVGASGTPHLQGQIWLKKAMRYSEFKLPKEIHWEKTRNEDAAEAYCSKLETRSGRTLKWGFKMEVKIIDDLRPFQKSLRDIITGPVDGGKIHWVYDPEGQLGKTEFLRYMNVKHGVPFTYGGKCADIINLVYNAREYMENTDRAALIYNFGRDTDMDKVSYKSMEQVSDGCISNSKFEAGCFVCNKPHVVVLANGLPDRSRLTESRWKIYTIKELALVDYVD